MRRSLLIGGFSNHRSRARTAPRGSRVGSELTPLPRVKGRRVAVRQLAGAPLSRSSFGDALQLLELCRAQSLPTQHRTSACFDRSFIQAHAYAHAQLNGWMILVTDGARNPTRCACLLSRDDVETQQTTALVSG